MVATTLLWFLNMSYARHFDKRAIVYFYIHTNTYAIDSKLYYGTMFLYVSNKGFIYTVDLI